MKNLQVTDCPPTTAVKLERVNFFDRQLLTANDMIADRDYFLQKLRRHNRFLHGWGVVCGLTVTIPAKPETPWQVQIGTGYALGPYGDEIFVGQPVFFDLAACLTGGVTNPCEPTLVTSVGAGVSTTAWLAIKYAECLSRPVQVAFSGCGCDSDPCQYSRIRDSFQLSCLSQLPPSPPQRDTLCDIVQIGYVACPPCPTEPWVVLAKINLPESTNMSLPQTAIDMGRGSRRRILVSTAILQDQVISCCCEEAPPPPPPPAVNIKAINVRAPNSPAWTNNLNFGSVGSPQIFDYEVILNGPAPAGGLPITVSAASSTGATVTLANSNPVVPAGQTTSPPISGNSMRFNERGNNKATLTATDPSGDKQTATLTTLSIPA